MVGSKVGIGGDVGRDGGGDESSMMISSLVRDALWLRIVASTESRLLSERESGDGPKSEPSPIVHCGQYAYRPIGIAR